MTKTKISVILYAALLSAALLLPAIAMPFLDHDARSEWENRNLTKLPELKQAIANPKPTFAQLDDYTNDHIGGGFQVIKFRKNFHNKYFRDTGDKYITRGRNGAMFLTAPFSDKTRERPFSWWTSLCVSLQIEKRQAAYAERVRDSNKLLSSRGAKVIFSSVPTKPGIMPQNAALSTPKDIKKACEELSAKENHITKIASLVPEANFFYPFEAFKSRATDPKFFPNPAYHWAGESGWVFAEEFAKTFDLKLSPAWDFGPCEDKLVRWDIGRLTGVSAETPGCNRNFDKLELSIDEGFKYSVGAHGDADDNTKTSAPKKIKMTKFENPHVKTGTKAVVLSNSFGRNAAEQLASIFTTTYHFNTNGVSVPKLNSLYLHSDFLEVDYIILVAGDFHYPKFLNNARVKDFNPEK